MQSSCDQTCQRPLSHQQETPQLISQPVQHCSILQQHLIATAVSSSSASLSLFSPEVHPSTVLHVHNESDLAQAISSTTSGASTGPGLTTILLPASLALNQALPMVTGPLNLISAGSSSALISCSAIAPAFTALTVLTGSFKMSGITWSGCNSVLDILSGNRITIDSCSFQGNITLTSFVVSAMMSSHGLDATPRNSLAQSLVCSVCCVIRNYTAVCRTGHDKA